MNNTKKRIVVTGIGVVSSIGIGQVAFWDNLIKGKSGISNVTSIDTSMHITHRGGEIKNFKPAEFIDERQVQFISRGTQLTAAATKLAVGDAGLEEKMLADQVTAFCLGTTLGELPALEQIDRRWLAQGPHAVDNLSVFQFPTTNMASYVAHKYRLKGPVRIFTTACAAGNYAIGCGYDFLQMEEADMVLAGGADAFSWIPFTGFNQFRVVAPEKCQPFDKNRKGMMVGEGSGIIVLETLKNALARNAKIYAEVLGYGASCDAYHVTNTQADGIYACMNDALQKTGLRKEDVDYICAHGTGTRHNDRSESEAVNRLFGNSSKHIAVSSIKSMLGHTMGAASAIEALACCLAVANDILPPTINFETRDPECNVDCVPNEARKQTVNIALNNGFAFGGNNATLVVKKYS